MILTKINLKNFRNYFKQDISFNKGINIIIGQNAKGKTNILESIYVLGLTKSYRTNTEVNLINFNESFFNISGKAKFDNGIVRMLGVNYNRNLEKKLFINKKEINRVSDYVSILNIILVSPNDLEIVCGSPIVRRNFLNIELSQIFTNYLKRYNEFNKILKMRNEYLKILSINRLADKRYLESINEKIIETGAQIIFERNNFLIEINNDITNVYNAIFGSGVLKVYYKTSCDISKNSIEDIKNSLRKIYAKNELKEIEAGMTLYGPHRDDFSFKLNDIDIKEYGSQGQQKLAVIALKLSEINFFNKYTKESPILLLDDIFSELDKDKRKKVLNYIVNKGQVIITSNELNEVKNLKVDYKVFNIKNNEIKEKVVEYGK